jgi:LAGLIDADG DNA endonuclease family
LLSDGWLIFGSPNSKNARLGLTQSLANSGYLLFVFNLLSHYCFSYPYLRIRQRLGITSYSLEFITRYLPCFSELHSLFYVKKIKLIPDNIYDLLTPIAFAH